MHINQAGAVYLFENEIALENFKSSPLVASVLSHQSLSDFDLKERDILKDASDITHAPLEGVAMA